MDLFFHYSKKNSSQIIFFGVEIIFWSGITVVLIRLTNSPLQIVLNIQAHGIQTDELGRIGLVLY